MKSIGCALTILAVFGLLGLTGFVPAEAAPVLLRYGWVSGQELSYEVSLHDRATSQGIWVMTTDMDMGFTLAVREVAGDVAHVDLQYHSQHMTMKLAGVGNLEVTVDSDKVEASLDGQPLAAWEMEEFERELKPVQELMDHPVRLQISSRGEILDVQGAEDQVVQDLTIGMVLPELPLNVGDQFEIKQSLGEILPDTGGQPQNDVELTCVYVFQGMEGDHLARIEGTLAQDVKGISIEGIRCDLSLDLSYTSLFDTANGHVTYEKMEGTIVTDPAGSPAIAEEVVVESVLALASAPPAAVEPGGKLTAAWGSIKRR